MRLRPIGLNSPGDMDKTNHILRVLVTPPPRLKMNAGPRNVPVNNDARVTRMRVIVIATRIP